MVDEVLQTGSSVRRATERYVLRTLGRFSTVSLRKIDEVGPPCAARREPHREMVLGIKICQGRETWWGNGSNETGLPVR